VKLTIHPTSKANVKNEWRYNFIPRTCLHGVERDFFTNATYVILCSQLRAVFRLILFGLYSNTTGLSSWRQPIVTNNCASRYAWKFFSPARWSVAGRPDRGHVLQQTVKETKRKKKGRLKMARCHRRTSRQNGNVASHYFDIVYERSGRHTRATNR